MLMLTKWCKLGRLCQSVEGFLPPNLGLWSRFYVAPVLPTANISPQLWFDRLCENSISVGLSAFFYISYFLV